MDNLTSSSQCSITRSEADPIVVNESINKYPYDDNKTEFSSYQMAKWGLENNGRYKTIFDNIEFSLNKVQENTILEEIRDKNERCECYNTLMKIRKILESISVEPNETDLSSNTSQEDISCNVSIDLQSDNNGRDLEYFDLDGEYLRQYFERLECNQSKNEAKSDNNGKDLEYFDVDEEFRNTYFKRLECNQSKNEANVNLEKKESIVDEPTEFMENQEKPEDEKLMINSNDSNQKVMSKPENVSATENIIKSDDGVQVKRKKMNTKRRKNNNLKKVQLAYKKYCSKLAAANKNKVQEKECTLKYVYTYGEDYRGGIKVGHKNCCNREPISPNISKATKKKIEIGNKSDEEAERKKELETFLETKTNDSNSIESSYEDVAANNDTMVDQKPLLQLNKTNGTYKITMNSMTHDQQSVTEEPIVFTLNTIKNNTASSGSSTSSFEMDFDMPVAKKPLQIKKRNAHTMYDEKYFKPQAEKSSILITSKTPKRKYEDVAANNFTMVDQKPLLQLNKTNGTYKITMNSMTHDQQSVAEEPIVFTLNTIRNNTSSSGSSTSSFEMDFDMPVAKKPLQIEKRNAHTMYDEKDFKPQAEKSSIQITSKTPKRK